MIPHDMYTFCSKDNIPFCEMIHEKKYNSKKCSNVVMEYL